jgi:hypothetical protein
LRFRRQSLSFAFDEKRAMTTNYSGVFVLLLVLTIMIGLPLICVVLGFKRLKTIRSHGAKALLGAGIAILCAYLLAILAFVVWVGPGRSGIVEQGISPEGRQYCVVQTFKDMVEPYQVSFYIRDAVGVWRWNYLEHEDVAWRSAAVTFSNGVAKVSRNGAPFRDIVLPTNTVDLASVQPGYRDEYCPSNFTSAEILEFHNRKYK